MTLKTPKPLIKLKGRPLITYALDYMVCARVQKIAVNLHHLGEQIRDFLGDSYQGVKISYLEEPEILGTGGGLLNACEQVLEYEEPVFLMNADIAVDLDLESFLAFHEREKPDATLLLKTVENPEEWGAIGTGESDQVKTMLDHIEYNGPVLKQRMFCGTHLISAKALQKLPKLKNFGIIDCFYAPLIQSGGRVLGFEQKGFYSDLGTLERLEAAEASGFFG